jgi:hypothetical protein
MNAGFFVLALTAAFNPKLLGADLLLVENRRPRAMFLCVLLGGMTVALTIGLPGAAYLTALHNLVTGKYSTATQVIAVIVFVVIEFSLILIPFTFLELRPEATRAVLKSAQAWLLGHAWQLMAYTALILGTYLSISGLIRLT